MSRHFLNRWATGCAALLFAASLSASPLLLTASGSFDNSAPSSAYSGANLPFALSFAIDSDPAVSNVYLGQSFDPAFSNFSYTLNGTPVTLNVGSITFYSTSDDGLFDFCLNTACGENATPADGLEFLGGQAYSGSEASPAILTGSYSTQFSNNSGFFLDVAGSGYSESSAANVIITPAPSTVPEPATWELFGLGLFALALWWKRSWTPLGYALFGTGQSR